MKTYYIHFQARKIEIKGTLIKPMLGSGNIIYNNEDIVAIVPHDALIVQKQD